jgi:hypothetical protein
MKKKRRMTEVLPAILGVLNKNMDRQVDATGRHRNAATAALVPVEKCEEWKAEGSVPSETSKKAPRTAEEGTPCVELRQLDGRRVSP